MHDELARYYAAYKHSINFTGLQNVSVHGPSSAVIQKLVKCDSLNKGVCVNECHKIGEKFCNEGDVIEASNYSWMNE